MQINSWPGLVAVVLAVICFYGTTYLVVALNAGWRFGYWITGSCFGVLMALLSIFWIVNTTPANPVGPHGQAPRWVPIAAAKTLSQVTYKGEPVTAAAQYPTGPWEPGAEGNELVEEFTAAVTTCLTTNPESLAADEQEVCTAAQELMPAEEDIPVLEGAAVAVIPQITEVRLAEENGQLAQASVRPATTDPRVSKERGGKELAPPFRVIAVLDTGSLAVPSYASLFIFTLFSAFHLWGLNRAEKRKLNPAVV